MIDPGRRDQLVIFTRSAKITDESGTEIDGAPAEYAKAWARVRYGSGQERREAAQERGTQAITIECDWNPTLDAVLLTDEVTFDGVTWDIVSRAPLGKREIHFGAVRGE